jgi:FKBP-type peptidyl-prolyl cis-trans isomerase
MRKLLSICILASVAMISACGEPADVPQQIQAVPENPADISIANIESVDIATGLSSRILVEGDGAVAEIGHFVSVHYTGWLYEPEADNFRGAKFDSSVDRGAHFRFTLGEGRVIRGWDQGVPGMHIGEIRELTIAPEMGYGERGAGAVIPPNSTLVFVVELAGIEGLETSDEGN